MKEHITTVGVLNIGLGVLGILLAVLVLMGTLIPGLIVFNLEGDRDVLMILSIIGASVALFLIVFSVPDIIGGIGLMRHRPWARYLLMVLGVIKLFNVPVGTAVGGYTIWVLMQEEAQELFQAGSDG